MDTRTRRVAGWVIAAAGVVIALIGVLADQIGLGEEDTTAFGTRQVIVLVVGLAIVAIGLAVARWPARSKATSATTESSATAP
jgi:uncharacterized membrane protein YidH (DUF202 family)